MPTFEEHRKKMKHNADFSDFLRPVENEYPDWLVTAYFYTALHLIDAYLSTLGTHPSNHHSRGTYIQRDLKLRAVYPDYRELEDISRDARYTARSIGPGDIQDSQTSLASVRRFIRSLFPAESI